jgi:glutathione S-transferase
LQYVLIFTGVTPEQAKYDKMCNALAFLDKFLEGENYVAGKTLTLADLSLAVTVSNYKVGNWSLLNISSIHLQNKCAWIRMTARP